MNDGFRWKKKLWSEQASAVREALVGSLGQSAPERVAGVIRSHSSDHWKLTAAVEQEACRWPEALRLMTHPGVGPLTALAFALIIGTAERLRFGKQIGRYIDSSPVKTPVPAINGWDTSASRATRCCATCWEKQRQQPHGVTRPGGVAIGPRRCVDRKTLPKWRWPENTPFGCTGSGAMIGTIRSWSSSVRTQESGLRDMA
jgi:hypothetical protein